MKEKHLFISIIITLFFISNILANGAIEISLTNENPTENVEFSGENYVVELLSATDNSASIRVSQSKELSLLRGGIDEVAGINVKLEDAQESNLEISADVVIENGKGESFLLTSNSPTGELNINGEVYSVELVASNDLASTIRITNNRGQSDSAEIEERKAKRVNGLFVSVEMSDENNFQISSSIIVGDNRFVLTEKQPSLQFEFEEESYSIELVSATDSAVNLRVSQTKEISEGDLKEVGDLDVGLVEVDETNLAISATISIGDSSEDEEREDRDDDEGEDEEREDRDDDEGEDEVEEGEIVIEEKRPDCNGCLFGDQCYALGYRKDGKFCSENKEFVAQLEEGNNCQNNFECSSNVCVSGECISPNLIQKIINFFKRLFGLD